MIFTGKPSLLYDDENPDWVPSQKMGYVISNHSDQDRYDRLKERRRRKRLFIADGDSVDMHDDTDCTDVVDGDSTDHTGGNDAACQASMEVSEVACQMLLKN